MQRCNIVITRFKFEFVLLALIGVTLGSPSDRAIAVTAEVAKKCKKLTDAAYPPREPGNPAAGSAKGTGRIQRDYFNKCLANDGKIDDDTAKEVK
jgi:hypothetical protein